jgi:hypothetical protein
VLLTRSDIRRIRTIFLSKKLVHVKAADVEGLTGAGPALLASWLVGNQFAADESSPLLTLPRGAAMAFVLETLPLEWIERALARQASVIPPLRRLQLVTLLLPRYQVRASPHREAAAPPARRHRFARALLSHRGILPNPRRAHSRFSQSDSLAAAPELFGAAPVAHEHEEITMQTPSDRQGRKNAAAAPRPPARVGSCIPRVPSITHAPSCRLQWMRVACTRVLLGQPARQHPEGFLSPYRMPSPILGRCPLRPLLSASTFGHAELPS